MVSFENQLRQKNRYDCLFLSKKSICNSSLTTEKIIFLKNLRFIFSGLGVGSDEQVIKNEKCIAESSL